jgi:hypothetical protein
MDIDNYIDYNVAQIFFGNTDWPGNNVSIWKYKTDDGQYHPEAPYGQDGRWRWLLKDTDFGFGLYGKSVTHNTLNFATAQTQESDANAPWATYLLRTLLLNPSFRNDLINHFADQMNTSFEPARVLKIIDEVVAGIQPEITEHTNRWQVIKLTTTNPRETTWSQNIEAIKNYAINRPSNVRQHIINKFASSGVTGSALLELNTDTTKGFIKINSIDIKASTPGVTNPNSWTGTYFKGVPVTLKAVPQEGCRFDHWEGITGVTTTSDTITFTPSGNMNITAVFNTLQSEGYKVSGYVNPDLESSSSDIKAGFKVEISDKQISAVTDSNGYFELTGVPASPTGYMVKISKPNYLSREVKNIVVSADTVIAAQTDPISIWAGDMLIDGASDNSINMTDIMEIARVFNTVYGDGKYVAGADLNCDNAINMSDIIIVANHFNTVPSSYLSRKY